MYLGNIISELGRRLSLENLIKISSRVVRLSSACARLTWDVRKSWVPTGGYLVADKIMDTAHFATNFLFLDSSAVA